MTATMERPLRTSEKRVHAAIRDLLAETGRNPTTVEVGRFCGLSQQRAHMVVCSLRRRGMVVSQPDGKLGLELMDDWAVLGRSVVMALASRARGDDPEAVQERYGLTADLLGALWRALG